MNEEEFDACVPGNPRTAMLVAREAQAGRLTTIGIAIWGRTSTDLKQRLLASPPEIPAECDLGEPPRTAK